MNFISGSVWLGISYMLAKYMMFIYEVVMQQEGFNILVTVYIGVTALIMALGIFAMDKGEIDKRSIFKKTLIKESNIKQLVRYTVLIFILILIQMVFPCNILKFFIRIAIFILTIIITLKIGKAFKTVITILVNEEEKEIYINKLLTENIENYRQKHIKIKDKYEESYKRFSKEFSQEDYISYTTETIYDPLNEYNWIQSPKEGIVRNLNIQELQILNTRIRNFLKENEIEFVDKEKQIQKNKYCILKKMDAEIVKKGEPLLYVKKELENFSIDYHDFYTIEREDNQENNVVRNQIIDLCQMYIDNLKQNNIFGMEKTKQGLYNLYDILIQYSEKQFFDELWDSLYELYRNFRKEGKTSLFEIFERFSYKSLSNHKYNEFINYFKLWFNLKKEELNKNDIQNIFFHLNLIKRIVQKDKNIADEEKEDYINFVLLLRQELYKDLFDHKKYDIILEDKEEVKIYNVNIKMGRIQRYRNNPQNYINLDLEKEIQKEKSLYEYEWRQLSKNNIIYLNMAEWARINYAKAENSEMLNFIEKVLHKFENYNSDDLIELYMFIQKDKSRLVGEAHFWEFEEGVQGVFSCYFDISDIIFLLLIKNDIGDKNKLRFRQYTTRENLLFFESIETKLKTIDTHLLEKLGMPKDRIESMRKNVLDYLQDIIEECKQQENEYIKQCIISEEIIQAFNTSVIETLKENKKENIIKFFEKINAVDYLNEVGNFIEKFDFILDKKTFVKNSDYIISENAKIYANEIMDNQSIKIQNALLEKAKSTNQTIDEIIQTFNNKDDLYMITPYYTNDFAFDYQDEQYYYLYENYKIPVMEAKGSTNKIIIGDRKSFGRILYSKIDNASEYTTVAIKEFSNNSEIRQKIEQQCKDWTKEQINQFIHLKCMVTIKQSMRYIIPKDVILYKRKIRD